MFLSVSSVVVFFFKQKTAYEMRISDWSSDVCSSDLEGRTGHEDYLRRLDGMVIGDSPVQGFVRGRHFIHPTLRFTFTVPPEFMLVNGPAAVRARDRKRVV